MIVITPKRQVGRDGSRSRQQSGISIKGKFILILILFAVLCMTAFGMVPNDWVRKGNAFFYQGRYDGAIKAYDKAIEINPKLADAWYNKGKAFKGMGKYDEAIKAYDKAIEINPRDADAWSNKGDAFLRQGKYDEAIKTFDKVIEINPQDAEAWKNRGTINTMRLLNALIRSSS